METRFEVAVTTGVTHGTTLYRREMETHRAASALVASLPPREDPVAAEACRLLDDVRMALDGDLPAASKMAGRLAMLLANKLPQESASAPARGGLAPWQKRMVRKHIDEQHQGRIRVGDLAKLVSLSPSYFSRAFKVSFGERPHNFIMRIRIERSQSLMLTTSLSLSQIALACGLVDQAHLCRCFRQTTGTTPGVWRHNHAKGPYRPAL